MKSIKRTFAITLFFIVSQLCHAYDFEVDGAYYSIISIKDLTCKITYKNHTGYASHYGYTSDYSDHFTIPSHVYFNGKKLTVTEIDEGTFYGCSRLSSVVIPNTIVSIGAYAFFECEKLEELSFPESLTYLGHCCDSDCTNLKRINITSISRWCDLKFTDNAGCSNPLSVAHNLYLNGKLVTDLEIPRDVSSINEGAFYGCTCITSLSFEQGSIVTKIGASSFKECVNLKKVHIPSSVDRIGKSAFSGCI